MVTSLRRRLAFYILLPVAMMLLLFGFFGFTYAKDHLLNQWRESSILKLQRAAHLISMRLAKPTELISMFHQTGGLGYSQTQQWLLSQLEKVEGVERVNLEWQGEPPMGNNAVNHPGMSGMQGMHGPGTAEGMIQFQRGENSYP